jgi:hypothetical protein
MCLHICLDQKKNEKILKRWFGRRQKFAYVYKVLQKRSNEDFYRSTLYQNFKWDFRKQKIFEVDRSSKPTEKELYFAKINKGLHVFTSLEKAESYRSFLDEVIVKFRVNKEDIIAVESYIREAVCKRLGFVRVL